MRTGVGSFGSAVLATVTLVSGCGKSDPVGPRVATSLTIESGNNQQGAVGSALPIKIRVIARDGQGPLGNTTVNAAPTGQSGIIAPTSIKTDVNGAGEFTWTLGPPIGPQTMTFSAGTSVTTSASAVASAGAPALLTPTTDAFQFVVVGHPVTVLPTVRVTDAFGNVLSNVSVSFDAPVEGSTLTGTTVTSSAGGLATLGGWTIGNDALIYNVRARLANGAAVLFEARGVPSNVTVVTGSGQTGNLGTALPITPAVKAVRDNGAPLPGVPVSFVVTSGNGQVQGPDVLTGADGIARPTRWILGLTPGANGLEARVFGTNPVAFTATAVQAVAALAVAASPTMQAGFFGNFVTKMPAVLVTDAGGDAIFNAAVTFQLQQGDGTLKGTTVTTDALGVATLGSWRLGSAPSHSVRATVAGLPPVDFTATATAPPPSTFKIDVRFTSTVSANQRTAFDLAAARWTQIIVAGGAPYPVNEAASSCFPAMNETVDGVVIFASIAAIDGPGKVLGFAGPCIVRDDHGFLSAVGVMQFDIVDIAGLEVNGRLNDVILHEMAHVLGFGTLWNFDVPGQPSNALLSGAGSSDPFFVGSSARGAFLTAVQSGTFTGNAVPVEGTGGAGTADSHWRETTVTNELMTGFLNNGVNPLSAFTAASFRDLGYVVNDAIADPFSFTALLQAPTPSLAFPFTGTHLVEGRLPGPIIVINRQGRRVATLPRK